MQFLDTNIFVKLIKDRSFYENMLQEARHYNNLPAFSKIFFTPFVILEYLGIRIRNPILKYSDNTKNDKFELKLMEMVSKSFNYYRNLEEISRFNILSVAENVTNFIDKENLFYAAFCDYILNKKDITNYIALHLAANYIYNYRFPFKIRRQIIAQLSYDLFRNKFLPYSVSKFRLVESDWETQYPRLKEESDNSLVPFDKALRLKGNGDFVDCDIVHLAVMGQENQGKTNPVFIYTCDDPNIILPRISAYKGLVRFVDFWIKDTNAFESSSFIENSEGVVVFISPEGKVIGKREVSKIPAFGKDPWKKKPFE